MRQRAGAATGGLDRRAQELRLGSRSSPIMGRAAGHASSTVQPMPYRATTTDPRRPAGSAFSCHTYARGSSRDSASASRGAGNSPPPSTRRPRLAVAGRGRSRVVRPATDALCPQSRAAMLRKAEWLAGHPIAADAGPTDDHRSPRHQQTGRHPRRGHCPRYGSRLSRPFRRRARPVRR